MKKRLIIINMILQFFVFAIINSIHFAYDNFGDIIFETAIYQIFSPMQGTSPDILRTFFMDAIIKSLIITIFLNLIIAIFFYFIKRNHLIKKENNILFKNTDKIQKIITYGITYLLYVIVIIDMRNFGVFEYVYGLFHPTMIYEEEYVDPNSVEIRFPDKKRNLVFIYLESMESSYALEGNKEGGLIPNLYQLAQDNISFSQNEGFGGYTAYDAWTMGALLSSTSGANYKLPLSQNSSGKYKYFLPGLTTLGDILKKEGYHNIFMCGSNADFGGRRNYFEQHGNYEIFDYYSAVEADLISPDYYEFWGYEDEKLFHFAKARLTELAQGKAPFNFTLLTVDTHNPEGYLCKYCKNDYSEPYKNIIACSDRQVSAFVDWIEAQNWFENTTIVIVGDHLMSYSSNSVDQEKRVYNCFVNADIATKEFQTKNRICSSYDLFPTTLSAIGAKIEGERLGLGTNLFSSLPTLEEKMGRDEFSNKLKGYSRYFYNKFIRNITN